MATLQELQAQRNDLVQARMSGTRSVGYGDGARVEYRSDAELVAAIGALDREIAAAQGVSRPTRILFSTSKGL